MMVQTLTHTMARLPAFQANGWRILTEFGALERAKKIDPRTWRKGLDRSVIALAGAVSLIAPPARRALWFPGGATKRWNTRRIQDMPGSVEQRERLSRFVDLARVYRGWTRSELSDCAWPRSLQARARERESKTGPARRDRGRTRLDSRRRGGIGLEKPDGMRPLRKYEGSSLFIGDERRSRSRHIAPASGCRDARRSRTRCS